MNIKILIFIVSPFLGSSFFIILFHCFLFPCYIINSHSFNNFLCFAHICFHLYFINTISLNSFYYFYIFYSYHSLIISWKISFLNDVNFHEIFYYFVQLHAFTIGQKHLHPSLIFIRILLYILNSFDSFYLLNLVSYLSLIHCMFFIIMSFLILVFLIFNHVVIILVVIVNVNANALIIVLIPIIIVPVIMIFVLLQYLNRGGIFILHNFQFRVITDQHFNFILKHFIIILIIILVYFLTYSESFPNKRDLIIIIRFLDFIISNPSQSVCFIRCSIILNQFHQLRVNVLHQIILLAFRDHHFHIQLSCLIRHLNLWLSKAKLMEHVQVLKLQKTSIIHTTHFQNHPRNNYYIIITDIIAYFIYYSYYKLKSFLFVFKLQCLLENLNLKFLENQK